VLVDVLRFEPAGSARILRVQAAWECDSARVADRVVVASHYAAEQVSTLYGVPSERIEVVPEPFDFSSWWRDFPRVAREPLVLAVGHAYPRKNYATLLAAWPLVQMARPDARLVIVGAGPESGALRRLAAGQHSITLFGHVPFEELRALYARASVFCHPSLQENFGIAVVEALASGLGMVTHQQSAVMETLREIDGTWCVDARQSSALSQAILAALDRPPPWPESRLDPLRERLAPDRIGAQLARLLSDLGVQRL
jgi:glycosyltransferase involved in cell wall biosynthesis